MIDYFKNSSRNENCSPRQIFSIIFGFLSSILPIFSILFAPSVNNFFPKFRKDIANFLNKFKLNGRLYFLHLHLSSLKILSKTQWSLFSIPQCPSSYFYEKVFIVKICNVDMCFRCFFSILLCCFYNFAN